jgi:hypothetical protein
MAALAALPSRDTMQLMNEHVRTAAGSRALFSRPICACSRHCLVEAMVSPAESSTPSAISPASLSICGPVEAM